MNRTRFEQQWANRLHADGSAHAPATFLDELGDVLRTLPPPTPPVPESFVTRHRKGLVGMTALLVIGFGLMASSDRKPHNPAGLAIAVESVNEQVAALPETADSFATAAYEREWECIKQDAEKLATPFPVSAFGLTRP